MRLHLYARLALATLFIVLSATAIFSPLDDQGGGSTAATVTPATEANPQVTPLDDRAEAIRFFHRQ